MDANLPATITKSASRQTFLTIRFLADKERMEDAFRAYAYFRWLDDCIDVQSDSPKARNALMLRQQSLLQDCYQGINQKSLLPQEEMLLDLVRRNPEPTGGLHTYLHNMMAVMAFDAGRRGRLVTQSELDRYTHLLASAVTEAMHFFIGHDCASPQDDTRYLAVTAAHITHMLRDSIDDINAGYFNIPREVLDSHHISPYDTGSPAYRAWVAERVRLARRYFRLGRTYLHRVSNLRCRLAGFAYTARFEWLLDTIEREGFRLRKTYEDRKGFEKEWRMYWLALSASLRNE